MIRSEKLFNGVPPSSTIIQIKDPQKAFIKKWIHAATGATFHGKRKPRRSGANFLAFSEAYQPNGACPLTAT
jgi:hypothetical protein